MPDPHDLPGDWTLGSTDLNANGMTISILGPASADGSTPSPSSTRASPATASSAQTAMQQNRAAAEAAGAKIIDRLVGRRRLRRRIRRPARSRRCSGSATSSGQIADGGSSDPADLAEITNAVARAMGDKAGCGRTGATASDAAGSGEPTGSGDVGLGSAETGGFVDRARARGGDADVDRRAPPDDPERRRPDQSFRVRPELAGSLAASARTSA